MTIALGLRYGEKRLLTIQLYRPAAPQFFKVLVGAGSQNLLITGLFGAEKFIMCGT